MVALECAVWEERYMQVHIDSSSDGYYGGTSRRSDGTFWVHAGAMVNVEQGRADGRPSALPPLFGV